MLNARRRARERIPDWQGGGLFSAPIAERLEQRLGMEIKGLRDDLENLRHRELESIEERQLLFNRAFAAEKTIYYELFTKGQLSERAYRDLCHAVGLEADAMRQGLPMPADPLHFQQDRALRVAFLRLFDKAFGFTGLPERLRLAHVAREYEESWGRYQGCARILDEMETLVLAASAPSGIVAEVIKRYRAWKDTAEQQIDATAEQFPEFVNAMQERLANRLPVHAATETTEKEARAGSTPGGVRGPAVSQLAGAAPARQPARVARGPEEGIKPGGGDATPRIGGLTFFADGALGSLTAWMLRPYEHGSDTGLPLQPVHQLEERVRRCLQNGLAPAIHAIGDRANREVLDIIERAQALAPSLPRRIEHAQLLEPEDSMRFVELGVSASMQPIHATQDYLKVDREWGARGSNAYVFASLLWSGANVAFGSDSPVGTMSPIAGIHAAVTRRTAAGEPPGGWFPEEAMSLEAALAAYTTGCATACGEGERLGKIAKGFMGDFVVLSQDLFALDDPMRILETAAVATVVGGEIVYRA